MVTARLHTWHIVLAAAFFIAPTAAGAGSLGAGVSEGDRVRALSLTGQFPLVEGLPCPDGCAASLVMQMRVAYWWTPYEESPGRELWDFGAVPAIRIAGSLAGGRTLIVSAGVGAHYLTRDSLGIRRGFGSHLQFGEFLEVGVAGALHGADVLLRLEHVSNGATAVPNNGVTFLGLEVRMPLATR